MHTQKYQRATTPMRTQTLIARNSKTKETWGFQGPINAGIFRVGCNFNLHKTIYSLIETASLTTKWPLSIHLQYLVVSICVFLRVHPSSGLGSFFISFISEADMEVEQVWQNCSSCNELIRECDAESFLESAMGNRDSVLWISNNLGRTVRRKKIGCCCACAVQWKSLNYLVNWTYKEYFS